MKLIIGLFSLGLALLSSVFYTRSLNELSKTKKHSINNESQELARLFDAPKENFPIVQIYTQSLLDEEESTLKPEDSERLYPIMPLKIVPSEGWFQLFYDQKGKLIGQRLYMGEKQYELYTFDLSSLQQKLNQYCLQLKGKVSITNKKGKAIASSFYEASVDNEPLYPPSSIKKTIFNTSWSLLVEYQNVSSFQDLEKIKIYFMARMLFSLIALLLLFSHALKKTKSKIPLFFAQLFIPIITLAFGFLLLYASPQGKFPTYFEVYDPSSLQIALQEHALAKEPQIATKVKAVKDQFKINFDIQTNDTTMTIEKGYNLFAEQITIPLNAPIGAILVPDLDALPKNGYFTYMMNQFANISFPHLTFIYLIERFSLNNILFLFLPLIALAIIAYAPLLIKKNDPYNRLFVATYIFFALLFLIATLHHFDIPLAFCALCLLFITLALIIQLCDLLLRTEKLLNWLKERYWIIFSFVVFSSCCWMAI